MAGNFWHSSHCAQWLIDRTDLLRERQSDYAHLLGLKNDNTSSTASSQPMTEMLPALKPDQLTTSSQDYQKILIFFANLIQTLGEQLKLRQQVIATATVYFKRFYAQNSLRSIDPLLLAPTAVFLASKIEEFGVISNTRLINTCSSVIKNKFAYAYPCQDFPYRANHILECEFFLLENMDCSLVIFQPYRPLIHFVQDIVSGGYLTDEQCTSRLLPVAWRLLNDSLRTDASLLYAPYQIALAVLHIASVVVFSEKSGNGQHQHQTAGSVDSGEIASIRQWFLELHVSLDVVKDISRMLIGLYQMWKTFDLRKDMAGLLSRMPKPQTSSNV